MGPLRGSVPVFIILNVVVFTLFLALNWFTPLHGDDLDYSRVWGTDRPVATLADAFSSTLGLYLYRHGRLIPSFLISSFSLYSKHIFDVLNALVYAVFINMICLHIAWRRIRNDVFMLVCMALWFCVADFGATMLWRCASCENLWSSALALVFLLPYSRQLQAHDLSGDHSVSARRRWSAAVAMFLAGVLSCLMHETVAIGLCSYILLFLVFKFCRRVGEIVPMTQEIAPWQVSGFAGAVLGCAANVFSPGNLCKLRSVVYSDSLGRGAETNGILLKVLYRGARETFHLAHRGWPLLLAICLLLIVTRFRDPEEKLMRVVEDTFGAIFYCLTVLAFMAAMLFCVGFSLRLLIFPVTLLIVAAGKLYGMIEVNRCGRWLISVTLMYLAVAVGIQYTLGLYGLVTSDSYLWIRTEYTGLVSRRARDGGNRSLPTNTGRSFPKSL
jgi:hypothetical protein